MNILTDLAATPGVIAAGEYSYRGDRFTYEGQLDEEKARMASIMCRATTMAVHMQTDILKTLEADCGCAPARGQHGDIYHAGARLGKYDRDGRFLSCAGVYHGGIRVDSRRK